MCTPGFPLLDLAIPLLEELSDDVTEEQKEDIKANILAFINKEKMYDEVRQFLHSYSTFLPVLDKIKTIMNTENDPIPVMKGDDTTSPLESPSKERKKTRQWNDGEDNRLLMGVYLYGLDNWNAIANYVGNGRVRSQVMQRWSRGLDPRISKKQWTKEEEELLLKLVEESKDISWIKISSHFGNRSDVQCRYKYIQLQRPSKYSHNHTEKKVREESHLADEIFTLATQKKSSVSIASVDESAQETPNSPSSDEISSPIELIKPELQLTQTIEPIDFNFEISESPQFEQEENILLADFQITMGDLGPIYTSRAIFDSSIW